MVSEEILLNQRYKKRRKSYTGRHESATFDKKFAIGLVVGVRKKWGQKHPLPLQRCPASAPEPISIVLLCRHERYNVAVCNLNSDFEIRPQNTKVLENRRGISAMMIFDFFSKYIFVFTVFWFKLHLLSNSEQYFLRYFWLHSTVGV